LNPQPDVAIRRFKSKGRLRPKAVIAGEYLVGRLQPGADPRNDIV